MKIFFDTESTGLHQDTTLISIGLVAENRREFYAEFTDYAKLLVDPWVRENIIDNLIYTASLDGTDFQQFTGGAHIGCVGTSDKIAEKLVNWFLEFDDTVEMWSDCLSFDWVLFCQLFWNRDFELRENVYYLPKNVYYIPFDISTLFWVHDIDPDINREEFVGITGDTRKHNALWDAQIIRACFDKLVLLAG